MRELRKALSRRVHIDGAGDFVITLDKQGIAIRRFRHHKAMHLPYREVARRALEWEGAMLTVRQWATPLKTLGKLARIRCRRTNVDTTAAAEAVADTHKE